MARTVDTAIIGAGGAGMMCAIVAAKRGKKVLLIDHAQVIGRKILISGGGRCNFTNIFANPESYVSNNPHFAKSALARYTPGDFIELVERHGIAYHEKKLGQLFCDNSAQEIVDMLVDECEDAGVEFLLNCDVKTIIAPAELGKEPFRNRQFASSNAFDRIESKQASRQHEDTAETSKSARQAETGRYVISTTRGEVSTKSLVIATGGLSVPKVGATGFGYSLARHFGLKIVDTAPALDGFVFNESDLKRFLDLQGISVDSVVTCNGASFRENILFTHRGLSGPASLQASLYWNQGSTISINLSPDTDIGAKLIDERANRSRKNIRNILPEYLPQRLAQRLCEDQGLDDSIQHISDKSIQQLSDTIKSWQLRPSSTVGYIKAEVTKGGVDTDELSSRTMEAKRVSGLYFIGEVVDVTGQLGGYNFQWAWASGNAAGEALS